MHLAPFAPEHLTRIEPREDDLVFRAAFTDHAERVQALAGLGPAFTLMDGDEPVASAGIMLLSPGVGEAWAALSRHVTRRPVAVHRRVARYLALAEDNLGLNRVQALCLAANRRGGLWFTRLGFAKEGRLRRFLPGGVDVDIYARLRPWNQ